MKSTSDKFPVIQTPRLTLRELTHTDAPRIFAIQSDQKVMQWMGRDAFASQEEAHHYVARHKQSLEQNPPHVRWGIERNEDGLLLGSCGLFNYVPQWKRTGLGYELAADSWKQGYMQEALTAVIPWAFENWQLNRVDVWIHPDNAASLNLGKRLGFQLEGRMRQIAFFGGSHHDMLCLGLLRQEWNI